MLLTAVEMLSGCSQPVGMSKRPRAHDRTALRPRGPGPWERLERLDVRSSSVGRRCGRRELDDRVTPIVCVAPNALVYAIDVYRSL